MKTWLRDNRGFLIFLLCFAFFRTAIADWNPVPSASMRPTILEGDVVFVNRLAYDFKLPLTDVRVVALGEPRRGDIVTFSSPVDGTRLVKRIVGLPGDMVEMREEQLFINGQPQAAGLGTEVLDGRTHAVQFLPARPALRSFAPLRVPEGSYFMLGDNRDDSADSRYFGSVPREKLIDRAERILVSADITDRWQPRPSRWLSPLL